ncbi:MAG: hypothetical protein AAGD14_00120 [Planctomycetota bacterium]
MRGTARAATRHPVVNDDPSEEFLDDTETAPDNQPIAFNGTNHYELTHGNEQCDRLKWAKTDYIHWITAGATLRAKGRCHDGNPKHTTRVASKAWGGNEVEVEITEAEGKRGTIDAENRIGFECAYTVSGGRILEATVMLTGTCVDMKGGSHRFAVADTRAESTSESEGFEEIRRGSVTIRGRTAASVSTREAGTASEVEGTVASESEHKVAYTRTRRLAEAGSFADSETAPAVTDTVSGKTPLSAEYQVSSAGSVVLTARGDADSDSSGLTIVTLDKFLVENILRVWKRAEVGDPGGGDDDDPGGPTTPSDKPRGPDTPGEDGGAEDVGDGDPEAEKKKAKEGKRKGPVSGTPRKRGYVLIDTDAELRKLGIEIELTPPYGRRGEPGAVDGTLVLALTEPAPRDLDFALRIEPEGAVRHPFDSVLTFREGEQVAGGSLIAESGEELVVTVHLLDAAGELTGREGSVRAPITSTAESTAPRLRVSADGEPSLPGAGATIFGLRGRRAPDLIVGRTGFDGFETEPTVIAVAVEDPGGLLIDPPREIVIPAGEEFVAIPMPLGDVEAGARLRLTSGDEQVVVDVVGRTQAWRAPLPIRVPLGAEAPIAFELLWPERGDRDVEVTCLPDPQSGVSAATIGCGGTARVAAGTLLWGLPVRGHALGSTTVRVATEGLPDLLVPVQVVPARIRIVGDSVRLTALPVGTRGVVRIDAPRGVVFASATVPAPLAGVLRATGAGTSTLRLELDDSPDLPPVVEIPFELGGERAASMSFEIDERLEEDVEPASHHTYRIRREP